MMAAISASMYEKDILILERNDVAGKKIPATGNGKCNYTNLSISEKDYYGEDTETAFSIYEKFDNQDTIRFFNSLGILKSDRNGYCYPYSGLAASVRDALLRRVNELKIPIIYDFRVANIEYSDKIYTSTSKNKESYTSSRLLIAAGGQAQGCFGTDGSMYYYLRKLGHSIITPVPALCGLKLQSDSLNRLSGVRHEAMVTINVSDRTYNEYGEIIFSKNGISGIPVMNLSRFALVGLENNERAKIHLDLIHDLGETMLAAYITKLIANSSASVSETLQGILNIKLVCELLFALGIDKDTPVSALSIGFADRFASLAKNYSFEIIGSYGFENAQVTAGGVPLSEVDHETLESKICPNLFFAGEILDVDAKCGGYNLQWAWSSGAVAGAYSGGGCFDKSKLC